MLILFGAMLVTSAPGKVPLKMDLLFLQKATVDVEGDLEKAS